MRERRSPLLLLAPGLALAGCAAPLASAHRDDVAPIEVAIVPGCPSEPDGRPSRCQLGRALAAAALWERGLAERFIVSGAAVHTPFVEAEALAAAMAAAGVPPGRIVLEPHALHTDENMAYARAIARGAGWRRLAVVSSRGHAVWACGMLRSWGEECIALGLDLNAVDALAALHAPALAALRADPVPGWVPLPQREEGLARARGTRRRPSSALLYPWMALRRLFGRPLPPAAAPPGALVTWAERRP